MKKQNIIILLAALICFAGDSDFESSGYARGGAEFLKLPRHALSAGLAGAVVAMQEEMAGFQYNPAILDIVGSKNGYPIIGSYSFMNLDRKHIAIDATAAVGDFLAAGISLTNYSIGNIEGRDDYGNLTDDFDYRELAMALSIAGRLQLPISWGVTVRYLSEQLEFESANGFGLDFGATYRPIQQLCIGVSGQNVASYLWWSTNHRDIVLPVARLGVAGLFIDTTLTVELDVSKTLKQPLDLALGIQYKLFDILYVRGGMASSIDFENKDYRDFDFSLGIGMRSSMVGFDYACPITSSRLGVTHKISAVIKFPAL